MRDFTFLAALTVLCGCEEVVGSGDLVTETRVTPSFSRVSVASALVTTIRNGETDVTMRMDDNLLSLIRTRVSGDTLSIDAEDGVTILPSFGAHIVVTSPLVEAVEVSGSSVADVGSISNQLSLEASGSSILRADVEAESVTLEVSGASDADLSGTVTTLDVEASGSSTVDSAPTVTEATLDVSGASRVSLRATQRVRIRASGASNVRVAGDPAERDVEASGSSTVRYE